MTMTQTKQAQQKAAFLASMRATGNPDFIAAAQRFEALKEPWTLEELRDYLRERIAELRAKQA